MNPQIEFIEMDQIESNSGHVYEQIHGEHDSRSEAKKKQVKKREYCSNPFLKTFLVASVIVIFLVLGWIFVNYSKQNGKMLISNSTSSTLMYSNTNVQQINDQHKSNDLPCGDWLKYQDEKCIKIIDFTFHTFAEAVESCSKLENGAATLLIINSEAEQNFVSKYLFKTARKVESFWIGAKFVNNKFVWIDTDTDLSYTNWAERAPKSRANYCVQMQAEEDSAGKWIDQPCEKKNLVVCQKMQTWSLSRLQKAFFETRRTNQKLVAHMQDFENLKQNIVPIGFIYAQLPNEKSPAVIWPWMKWTDVSNTYAGVFFRVNGGDAAAFGRVQEDNAPRLDQVFFANFEGIKTGKSVSSWNTVMQIPRTGWSDGIYTGANSGDNIYMEFKLSPGEVRPRNMAIHIWKRTG